MRAPRTIRVTRYVTPLREGGSLPAIVEADGASTGTGRTSDPGAALERLLETIVRSPPA